MPWRDYFYFSNGERNALIVLLCLITFAGIILILKDSPQTDSYEIASETSQQAIPVDSATSVPDTGLSPVISPPKKVIKKDKPREAVTERVKRLTTTSGAAYTRTEKFKVGTVIELNAADTTTLKKIPGIGTAFANRIVKYRNLLGGFYSVQQLAEVYGIDEDKYNNLAHWFTVDQSLIKQLNIRKLPQDSLRKHPYINYKQAKVIHQLRSQKKEISGWENLSLLDEFTEQDLARLYYYISFE